MVGNLPVLFYSFIDDRHHPTGATKHWIAGVLHGPFDALAICQDENNGFYLFYCDSNWEVITDGWHESIDDALSQAEHEYAGISKTWERLTGIH